VSGRFWPRSQYTVDMELGMSKLLEGIYFENGNLGLVPNKIQQQIKLYSITKSCSIPKQTPYKTVDGSRLSLLLSSHR
jgi:hypothetical protein